MHKTFFTFGMLFTALVATTSHAESWVAPSQLSSSATRYHSDATDYRQQSTGRFSIEKREVAAAVEDSLIREGLAENLDVTVMSPMDASLYQAGKPVTLKLHALAVSPERSSWQAQAYVLSEGKTLAVIPVSGRYQVMVRVPVLMHSMDNNDVIEKDDIDYVVIAERQLRKDTVRSTSELIGLAPRSQISAKRPVRSGEVAKPRLVSKKSQVEMVYSSDYMSIRSIGQALENGAEGDLIRVKNMDSERAVTARVIGPNKVEVNLSHTSGS